MEKQPASRSPLAVALELATRITTIGLGFSVPAVIGFGLDLWWGSAPVATLVGVVLGFASGLLQTIRFARDFPGKTGTRRRGPPHDLEKPRTDRPGDPVDPP